MKFNHLIQINDPLNPLIDPMSREELWHGLVLRAESPKLFMPHLDECRLEDKSVDSVRRELRYGGLVIRDKVTYLPQIQVLYEVPAQGNIPESRMSMTIEEPQDGVLFVRFEYDDGQPETADSSEAFYNEFRRSAYQEADIDTIRIIRELNEDKGSIH
ncbi:SRPBCC family protein [Herbaspirillum lusitanum]|uniref:SRPBCC family protein n=1 Tax=Herbaspirillum lusitanum TaxID=213312 RepID=A0ABW9A8D3_9BURK